MCPQRHLPFLFVLLGCSITVAADQSQFGGLTGTNDPHFATKHEIIRRNSSNPTSTDSPTNSASKDRVDASALPPYESLALRTRDESEPLLNSRTSEFLFVSGRSSFDSNQISQAVGFFDQFITLCTNSLSGRLWLARSLYVVGDFTNAILNCSNAMRISPTDAYAYYLLGLSWQKVRKPDEATKAFEKASVLDPNWFAPYFHLGQLQCAQGKCSNALANLQKSISLNSSNPSIWIWLGRDFCNLNQSGNAIAPLQRALALDPESAEANNWLRQALFNLKRYDDAIVLLTNHFSSHSNDAEDQLWLGYSHICKDDYQEAIKHLQRYNLMVPTNYYGNCYLAFALQRLNQDAEAADAYAAALRCVPGDYEANFERGFYLVAVQRFDEGIPNLEKALAAAPGGQPARWLLLYAYLATGQAGKIANLDLEFLAVIPALLALVYAVSLILLMKSSLRVSAKPAPGIGFTLLWFGLMVDGQIVVFSAAAIIFSQGLTFLIGAGMLLLAAPLAVTALLGFARQPWGEPFAWPPRLPSTKIILLGLAGLGAVIGFSFLYDHFIEHLTGRPIADQDIVTLLKAGLQKSPWLTVIGISLAAPITEEILFRGLLFGCLQRWLKPGWVVVITAAAFSLAHMQLVFIPPLFAVGLVLGLARQKTGNLALPIFLHALNNGVASLMLVGRP